MYSRSCLNLAVLALGGLLFAGPASVLAQPADYLFEFSQDIGADTELSDPFMDGDEAFDPGDVYWWQSAAVIPPGRNGFKDDLFIFGFDPWPDPAAIGSGAPVGNMNVQDYFNYFDLDGHDQIDFSLENVDYPHPRVPSNCIREPWFLFISFDDDQAPGWPAGDVPVTAPSPAGVSSYGITTARDEVLGLNLLPGGPPPYPIMAMYPFVHEIGVHGSMAPNPDLIEDDDDDVDSLDVVENEGICPFWYFSPDHEGHLGLDPGGIYLVTAAGPVQVIDEAFHLGIPEDTDVDAFEFVWLEDQDTGAILLALIYSVDEDDFLTTFADESGGGMSPGMIFGSFMTGFSFPLLQHELPDDVDALTNWWNSLEGCPNPGASGFYCSADCYPNNGDGIWDYTVDGDCKVDFSDLGQLLANYGGPGTREQGDVYPAGGDGWVGLPDLGQLLTEYGDDCN